LEAERSTLGGILLDNDGLFDVLEILRGEEFYRETHRKIFAAMLELSIRQEPIDLITLGDELRKRGDLEAVGGPAYIASLDASVPATANLERYARIVRDKALARRVIEAGHRIAREGYDGILPVEELLDSAQSEVLAIGQARPASELTPIGPTLIDEYNRIEVLSEKQSDLTGLSTGYADLDRITAGLQSKDLIIIAGRPSMGKTALVMNIVERAAVVDKVPVAVFSLEMGKGQLAVRMLSSEARVDGQRLRTGRLVDSDWPRLAEAADRIVAAPIHLDETGGLTIHEMRAKCMRLKARIKKLGLVVVDYLQLMRGGLGRGGGEGNREQEIAEISRGLKNLAKDLDVPVIALSQLNRSLERREDKRPQLSDLRESGSLEQDADLICFIYRDEVYRADSIDKGIAEILVAKQRNGPTGVVRVAFLRDFSRFENLAPPAMAEARQLEMQP
jgi:replicative DNA helicase